MAEQEPSNKKQLALKNWKTWENIFKKVSKSLAINGTTIPSAKPFHTIKIVLYYSIFTVSFYILNGFRLPSFDKLSFIKLIIYCITSEALGFSCGSGILAGQQPYSFPLSWHNISVGSCKLPTFHLLGGRTRTAFDIVIYMIYISLLLYLYTFAQAEDIHNHPMLLAIFILLLYFWVFDRIIFLSSRPEYYGTYLLCLYLSSKNNNGYLAAAQILQIAVWCWAGISKLGLWFDYVYPLMTANSPIKRLIFSKESTKKLYKDYPNDLRPSFISRIWSQFGVILEIAAGVLMIAPQTRLIGVFCSIQLHLFIILSFPAGAVQEWNVFNILSSLYLFYFNGNEFEYIIFDSASEINYALKVFLFIITFCIPLMCNVAPDWIDFLIGFRYYAGNWEQGTWVIKKEKWDSAVLPNLTALNKIPISVFPREILPAYGFRIISTPTGKSLLNLLKHLICDHHDIGYKLNCDEYELLDDGIVANMMYGWGWHWNENNLLSLRAKLELQGKGIVSQIAKYDIMVIYVKSIPTFSFCKPSAFNWVIYDFDHNVISKGVYTLKEIHATPHFTD